MKIEYNEKEIDSNGRIPQRKQSRRFKITRRIRIRISKRYADKDHCPCQKACRYHGNCKECVAIHRAHQEHVPNCMRPMINKKLKILSKLTEHTLANEIEAPKEVFAEGISKVDL